MCKCDPTSRTPWCGKPGCEMPVQAVQPKAVREPPANWEANGNAVHRRISKHFATCICVCEGEDRHANAQLIATIPAMLKQITELKAMLVEAYSAIPSLGARFDEGTGHWVDIEHSIKPRIRAAVGIDEVSEPRDVIGDNCRP